MKAVILAAGLGQDLLPLTATTPKALIPVLGKPLIAYQIEKLKAHQINEIFVVIGHMGEMIKNQLGSGDQFGVNLKYVEQPPTKFGIDEAVKTIATYLKNEEMFVLQHTDIISDTALITRTLNALDNLGADMSMAVALQLQTAEFGVVTLDNQGFLQHVYEETEVQEGNYVIAGTFVLTPKIFDYLEKGYHFNEAFNQFIKEGGKVACAIWTEPWVDVGQPWDVLIANRLMLEKMQYTTIHPSAMIESNTQIVGPVHIEEGVTVLQGSIIKGPAYIGKNVFIGNNALIRKGTVIEEGSVIGMGCEIKGSVLMKEATVSRLCYIGDSIVGEHSTIHAGCVTVNKSKTGKISAILPSKEVEVPLPKFGAVIGPNSILWPNITLLPGTIIDQNSEINANQLISGRIAQGNSGNS